MDIEEAIYKRRTIRRFKPEPIDIEILKKLVDFARLAPMGNNIQSIDYIIVSDPNYVSNVFPLLSWAGSLPKNERIPDIGRQPMAYIIVLVNSKIKKNADLDVGGAIENILLGAIKYGLGTCWMGSINRKRLRALFKIPSYYEIKNVISLGYPDEVSRIELYKGSFKYWKDQEGIMHIPKKKLDDIIFNIF